MAQVKRAEPGRDGKVRDVVVRYEIQKPGNVYSGQNDVEVRSLHRLVVLLPVEEQ